MNDMTSFPTVASPLLSVSVGITGGTELIHHCAEVLRISSCFATKMFVLSPTGAIKNINNLHVENTDLYIQS